LLHAGVGWCLAILPLVVGRTFAGVGLQTIHAHPTVLAGFYRAGIACLFAQLTFPLGETATTEGCNAIHTKAIDAGFTCTFVDIDVTKFTRPAVFAHAGESPQQIDTTPLAARIDITFIGLILAILTFIPHCTVTRVAINAIDACPSVEAHSPRTFVDVVLTMDSGITRLAQAYIIGHFVHTLAAIQARGIGTIIGVDFTMIPSKAHGAQAGITVYTIGTQAPILAGTVRTVIHVNFAMLTDKPQWTFAGVGSHAIHTYTPVEA